MLQSIKNIFSNNETVKESEDGDLDVLAGLMIEAANTDGNITQDELNKISSSLIYVFKEESRYVDKSLSKALNNKDNSRSLYFYTSRINKSFSN